MRFASLLVLVACTTPPDEFPAWNVYRGRPVELSSLRDGWRLYLAAGADTGRPARAHWEMYAVRRVAGEEVAHRVDRTDRLDGYVDIRTEAQALEFARLFTSPDTYFAFRDSECIEITPTEKKVLADGEIARAEFERRGFVEPEVARDGKSFTIRRYVASESSGVYRVEERVGRRGTYAVTERRLIASDRAVAFPFVY